MNFEFSEEQELLRESVRRFLDERAPATPHLRERYEEPRGLDSDVWKGLSELGVLGILVDEAQGGAGLGILDMGVVLEELGRVAFPGPYFSTALSAVTLLRNAAHEGEADSLLAAIADGRRTASVALLEEGDLATGRRCATVAEAEGADWRLHGAKCQVDSAHDADVLLVSARVGTSDGELGIFSLERDGEGVRLERRPSVDGSRKRADLHLAGATAQRLGQGDASDAIATTLDWMRVGLCADAVGAAGRALELSLAYAREREQFGKPIGSFQAIQHLLAEMLEELELSRAATYYALWALEAADAAEGHRAATLAKAHASQALPRIGAEAIQIFGGVGFTWEYDIHFYFKRLLSLESDLGGVVHQLEALAQIVLD